MTQLNATAMEIVGFQMRTRISPNVPWHPSDWGRPWPECDRKRITKGSENAVKQGLMEFRDVYASPVDVASLQRELEEARAALKWTGEVYPECISSGGAGVEMTWDQFNAMRLVAGFKPAKRAAGEERRHVALQSAPAPDQAAVRVGELEWSVLHQTRDMEPYHWRARTAFRGAYEIVDCPDLKSGSLKLYNLSGNDGGFFDSLDSAKAAAQKDFESRILSAISVTAASGADELKRAIGARAREIAENYAPHSDGRNTFVMFADWIDERPVPSAPAGDVVELVRALEDLIIDFDASWGNPPSIEAARAALSQHRKGEGNG
ncbi:MAG: hypothetical protein AB7I42_26420 [Bradyrhizobium sp.]|uniref:hypothetical protein n=1 Tax=Bradyrhizobium sp. TaxID=376 RepID=UPI003D0C752D